VKAEGRRLFVGGPGIHLRKTHFPPFRTTSHQVIESQVSVCTAFAASDISNSSSNKHARQNSRACSKGTVLRVTTHGDGTPLNNDVIPHQKLTSCHDLAILRSQGDADARTASWKRTTMEKAHLMIDANSSRVGLQNEVRRKRRRHRSSVREMLRTVDRGDKRLSIARGTRKSAGSFGRDGTSLRPRRPVVVVGANRLARNCSEGRPSTRISPRKPRRGFADVAENGPGSLEAAARATSVGKFTDSSVDRPRRRR